MATKQNTATKGKKTKRTKTEETVRRPKISWLVKPQGMELVEWQRRLREQVAATEPLAVTAVDERRLPGEYEVRNPQTRQTYKVVYRGEGSPWNYCSCMDFKTSRLCTCKHIEKVRLWIGEDRKRRVHTEPPAYTSVYLSYTEGRQVKIRVGSDHREEFMALAAQYFDAEGVMFPYAFDDYDKFLVAAANIDPSFRFYQDAIDYILEQRERKNSPNSPRGSKYHRSSRSNRDFRVFSRPGCSRSPRSLSPFITRETERTPPVSRAGRLFPLRSRRHAEIARGHCPAC